MNADVRRRIAFVAAALLLVSALLQFAAAAQRWLFFDAGALASEVSVEGHMYDYTFPTESWQSIGSAALLFGIGYLLLAVAMVILTVAVVPHSSWLTVAAVAPLVAASPVLIGIRAALSGLNGAPAFLGPIAEGGFMTFGVAQLVGLGLLTAFARRQSAVLGAGVVFLFGTTITGYLVATFWIVPMAVGYVSHDTTPWTEAFAAVCTMMAAMAVYAGRTVTTVPAGRPDPIADRAADPNRPGEWTGPLARRRV